MMQTVAGEKLRLRFYFWEDSRLMTLMTLTDFDWNQSREEGVQQL